MKPYHLILDFTHVYDDEICADREQFSWIDCSDIEGSDLYCSPQAEREICRRIEPYGVHGIHLWILAIIIMLQRYLRIKFIGHFL